MIVNKAFSERYAVIRRKEELQTAKKFGRKEDHTLQSLDQKISKLKTEKSKDDETSSSSSESEEEEEEAIDLFKQQGDALLQALRSNDPKLLDSTVQWFEADSVEKKKFGSAKNENDMKSEKPLFLKDYERKLITEKSGIPDYQSSSASEEDISLDEEEEAENDSHPIHGKTNQLLPLKSHPTARSMPAEEEKSSEDESDSEEEPVQAKRKNDISWWPKLFSSVSIDNAHSASKGDILRAYADIYPDLWSTYRLTKVDLKSVYSDEEDITLIGDRNSCLTTSSALRPSCRARDVDHYAAKGLPVGGKKTRVERRRERKERKAAEKQTTLAKLEEEKAIKMLDLQARANQIRKTCGKSGSALMEALRESYLDTDWDPQEHERLLTELFGDAYYNMEDDEEKPVFTSDSELDAPYEDEDIVAELNDDDNEAEEVGIPKRRDRRHKLKKKKKSQMNATEEFGGAASTSSAGLAYINPDFIRDENNQTRQCRFGYRRVKPCNYGLKVDEILTADVKELNTWCSIKKVVGYRNDDEEEKDERFYKSQKMQRRKNQILASLTKAPEDEEEEASTAGENGHANALQQKQETDEEKLKSSNAKKRRKVEKNEKVVQKSQSKKMKKEKPADRPVLSDARAAALGFNPKTYKHIPMQK